MIALVACPARHSCIAQLRRDRHAGFEGQGNGRAFGDVGKAGALVFGQRAFKRDRPFDAALIAVADEAQVDWAARDDWSGCIVS